MVFNVLTKEELVELYVNQQLMKDDIASKYGFKSRTPITRLLKQYNIKERSRGESRNIQTLNGDINKKIPKDILKKELLQMSILKVVEKYKTTRSALYRWMNEYDLTSNYYTSSDLWDGELDEECNIYLSIKELAIKYNVDTGIIKKYRKTDSLPEFYTIEKVKELILLYDINGQGFIKQIKLDDVKLLESIEFHTKDHNLQSNKLTEKIYRILNDVECDNIFCCKHCSNGLKFYTLSSGYGGENGICMTCLPKHNGFGVSIVSQKMFWGIYDRLQDKSDVYFNDLNHEIKIHMELGDKDKYDLLNTAYYRVDFVKGNSIIEFDGSYWHQDKYFDDQKDIFFESKGYKVCRIPETEYTKFPTETIEKCINFLIQ